MSETNREAQPEVKHCVNWQLLAVDLDGTLLDSDHGLPEVNRDALHRAHAAGLRIVLCTGRAFTETIPILEQIGLDLDATVTVFGALVTDVPTRNTLYREPIALDVATAATRWLRDLGYPVLWLNDANELGFDGFVVAGRNRHPAVDRWIERTPCVVREVADVPDVSSAPVRLSIIDEEGALEQMSARLRREFDGRLTHNVLHAPPYRLSLIEAFAPHVSKWHGIERLCRLWNVDRHRTVAVGDDVNDVAMLQGAALGVAMANAKPAAKAAADRTTGTNDAGGVAQLVDELLSTQD